MEKEVVFTFPVEAGAFARGGDAARRIKEVLKKAGIYANLIRRVTIAAYEAELNLIIHTVGGELTLGLTSKTIRLQSRDDGPGIADVEKAMEEGFSTAPEEARRLGYGGGMGLTNIKNSCDSFSIASEVDQGTLLNMVFRIK